LTKNFTSTSLEQCKKVKTFSQL